MLPDEAAFAASGTCLTLQGTSDVWIATGGACATGAGLSLEGFAGRRGPSPRRRSIPRATPARPGIFSIAFTDATHGVVVGGDYKKAREGSDNVALTSDGGTTWRLAKGPLPAGYMSAVAPTCPDTSGRSLVAVGLGGTALSTDRRGETGSMVGLARLQFRRLRRKGRWLDRRSARAGSRSGRTDQLARVGQEK